MAYLADANLLIALLHSRHSLSGRAVQWLDRQEATGGILICRVAQMAALRVLTNPAWMKEDVLPPAAVWDAWDLLLSDDRFSQVQEPAQLQQQWRLITSAFPRGRCAETDTYFAAFARAGRHRLVTFDRGFRQFEGLDLEFPS